MTTSDSQLKLLIDGRTTVPVDAFLVLETIPAPASDTHPKAAATSPGSPGTADKTPDQGSGHAVPLEAVMLHQALSTRVKMAGKEFNRAGTRSRWLGFVSTGLTAVMGLGVFATLQADPGFPARLTVGLILAVAAVLSAWQTWLGHDLEQRAPSLNAMVTAFQPLRNELMHALSECRLNGTPVSTELIERATKTLDDHLKEYPGEYPSYEEARHSAMEELEALGFLGPAAR
jgi:hypothetical protein